MNSPFNPLFVVPVFNLSLSIFFFVLFLFSSSTRRYGNLLLSLAVLYFLLRNVSDILISLDLGERYIYLVIAARIYGWLWSPAVYLYLKSMFFPSSIKPDHRLLWHLAPFTVSLLIWGLALLVDNDLPRQLLRQSTLPDEVLGLRGFTAVNFIFIQMVLYLLLSLRILVERYAEQQDAADKTGLSPLFWMCTVLLAAWAVWLIDSFHLLPMMRPLVPHHFVVVFFTGLLAYIGVYRLVTTPAGDEGGTDSSAEIKYLHSALTEEVSQEIARQLNEAMTERRLYRESDLTLPKLAEQLGFSHHQLSQVINQVHQVNFFEYVNRYRVEEAKRLLAASEWKSTAITDLGLQAGFASRSVFYATFKKQCQMTPAEYRKRFG
jgi:AraC-like DNA-binding protein